MKSSSCNIPESDGGKESAMRQYLFKRLCRSMALGFVLLAAAIPFAAKAQADAAEEPPDVVITIKAELAGNVEFEFREYKIFYKSDGLSDPPTDATVNGIPWPDLKKPFEMGFTPEFSSARLYAKPERVNAEVSPENDRITVSVHASAVSPAPYRVSVAMKRQENAASKADAEAGAPAAQQPEKKAEPAKKWVGDASSSGEILLKLEGNLNGRGVFLFDGDTITYRHESEAEYPRHVTIDDMPWDDLTKPFKLDYATEAPKAVITSRNGPNTVKLRKGDGKFAIEIDDSVYTWPSYRIVVASQHQADRKSIALRDLPIRRPPTDFVMPAMTGFPSLDMNGMPKSGRPAFDESSGAAPRKESPYQNDPDAPMFTRRYNSFGQIDRSTPEGIWEEGISQRKIILTGQFFGNGTFVFEGDTIRISRARSCWRRWPRTLPA